MLEKLLIILFICLIWGFISYKVSYKFFNWKSRKEWEKLEKAIEEDLNEKN